jgi:hypothetical protein
MRSIAPFFEAGPPPPSYPLVTLQTDLSHASSPAVPTITATEELSFRRVIGHAPAPARVPKIAPSPGPSRTVRRLPSRSPSPYIAPVPKVKPRVVFAANEDLASQSAESSSLSDIDESGESGDESEDELIRKPVGQAGRPNRGGYNLEAAMNWPPKTFQRFQVGGERPVTCCD